MSTISGNLALLQRTKAGQRALLEEMYPDLDFSTVPFREYGRLFTGRKYVPGFVGGWKAYGRSNDEDADTRKYLRDYSGNGRDIELFNFGWTEDSGYNTTTYPGALVSDGVDDYGQCIKGFALPDDYTVVAIRKILANGDDDCLAGKSAAGNRGAFLFEYAGNKISGGAYSYATNTSSLDRPALFSWQSKASYNEQVLNVGTGIDDETDVLFLFKKRESANLYAQFALYDLRIYDHSLTAEELEAVKDEMMADYENATGGGIADITYVADWDGKGRSNDEDADVRSKWIDKATGKVINLSNYSFSQMSGWGGYQFNWSAWQSDIAANGGTVIKTQTSVRMTNTGNFPGYGLLYLRTTPNVDAFKIRVTGLKDNATLFFYGSGANFSTKKDGVYTINYATPLSSELNNFRLEGYSANEETDLLIEQLPYYPGALVSDGVDDYISEDGTLGEAVGTVLIHWKDIGLKNGHYLYNTGFEDTGRLYCWKYVESDDMGAGAPGMAMTGEPIMCFTREPAVPQNPLNNTAGENNCPIFRLIFIKEQLDDTQQEFLMWKVGKEYRDWCKKNGYDYAIDEMLNN